MTLVWDRPKRRVQPDRIFFSTVAIAMAGVVLAGIAPSYYFRSASLPALTPLYQLHGFLFTTWIGVFIMQNGLVAGRRTDLHRRLGIAGAVLAAAVFVTGVVVSIETLRREGGGQNAQRFLSIPLGDITAFGALVTAGLLLRHNAAAHKRPMLLATISLLAAGFGRGLGQMHIAGRVPFFFAP